MRKLEVENISKTFVPDISLLTQEEISLILNTNISIFFNLKEPHTREIDIVWAKIICQNDNVKELLDNALRYLTILVKNRES